MKPGQAYPGAFLQIMGYVLCLAAIYGLVQFVKWAWGG